MAVKNKIGDCPHLIAIFLVSAIVRHLFNGFVAAPYIYTDEWTHVELARSLWRGEGMLWGKVHTNFPCWIYPLAIAGPLGLLPNAAALETIRAMNSLAMAATPLFTYGMAREITSQRRSLAAALLVALLPAFGYTPTIMAENFFMPAFALSMWLAFRAMDSPTALNRLVAGLSFGFAFHIKPQGLYLPIAFALAVFLGAALTLLQAEPAPGRWRAFLKSIGTHWLTALGWVLALIPRFWVITKIEGFTNPFTLNAFLGRYHGIATGEFAPAGDLDLIKSAVGYFSVWGLGAGILPVLVLAQQIVAALRGQIDQRRKAFVILVATMSSCFLLLILLSVSGRRVHERYFMVTYPAAIALFCAAWEPGKRALQASICLFLGACFFYVAWHESVLVDWLLQTDSPTISGMLLLSQFQKASSAVLIAICLLLAGAFGLFVCGKRFAHVAGGVAALFLAYNVGWYDIHHHFGKEQARTARRVAHEIRKHVPAGHRVLVLKDGLKLSTLWLVGFHNEGATVYFTPSVKLWYAIPLGIDEAGTIEPESDGETMWLLATPDFQFNKPADLDFGYCALYHLGGGEPLKLIRGAEK